MDVFLVMIRNNVSLSQVNSSWASPAANVAEMQANAAGKMPMSKCSLENVTEQMQLNKCSWPAPTLQQTINLQGYTVKLEMLVSVLPRLV